jgi:hypothetical protein
VNRDYLSRKVYAIYDEDTGLIKIGSSGGPLGRAKDLLCAFKGPLILLAEVSGGFPREMSTHKQLAVHRVRGEWFHATPDLWALVHAMRLEQAQDMAIRLNDKMRRKEWPEPRYAGYEKRHGEAQLEEAS